MTEESERAALQRAATDALKAGADCVGAIKMALNRTSNRRESLRLTLAPVEEGPLEDVTARITNGSMNGSRSSALHALYAAQGVNEDQDQDLTIQALTPAGTPMPPRLLNSMLSPISPTSPLDFRAPSAFLVTPVEPRAPEDTRLPPSPTRSDASAATPLEEKLLDGEIPVVSDETVDVSTADWGAHDYAMDDVAYNADGHLVLATLAVLVAKLTPHDQLVDSGFAAVFFLTFRLYTTPAELMSAIIDRYNLAPPARLRGDDVRAWQTQKGIPVRLRITGLLKTWLESYWRPRQDSVILDAMHNFTRDALAAMFPGPARRLLELIALRRSSGQDGEDIIRGPMSPRLGFALGALPPPPSAGEIPRPVMSKTLFAALRTHAYAGISITDFDATELARQLALLEHVRFAAIGAEEVLDMCREGAVSPASVKAVTGLSTAVTGWVTELILAEGEAKKRMGLVKFVIKLADVSVSLFSYQMKWEC
jgi:son of sevenless-like protein